MEKLRTHHPCPRKSHRALRRLRRIRRFPVLSTGTTERSGSEGEEHREVQCAQAADDRSSVGDAVEWSRTTWVPNPERSFGRSIWLLDYQNRVSIHVSFSRRRRGHGREIRRQRHQNPVRSIRHSLHRSETFETWGREWRREIDSLSMASESLSSSTTGRTWQPFSSRPLCSQPSDTATWHLWLEEGSSCAYCMRCSVSLWSWLR